jgi:hypothetical protein
VSPLLRRLIAFRTNERMFWLFDDYCNQHHMSQSEMLRTIVEGLLSQAEKPKEQGEGLRV